MENCKEKTVSGAERRRGRCRNVNGDRACKKVDDSMMRSRAPSPARLYQSRPALTGNERRLRPAPTQTIDFTKQSGWQQWRIVPLRANREMEASNAHCCRPRLATTVRARSGCRTRHVQDLGQVVPSDVRRQHIVWSHCCDFTSKPSLHKTPYLTAHCV